jgi:hypothetical protein
MDINQSFLSEEDLLFTIGEFFYISINNWINYIKLKIADEINHENTKD